MTEYTALWSGNRWTIDLVTERDRRYLQVTGPNLVDYPLAISYPDGRNLDIFYDWPERIPAYVKFNVYRILRTTHPELVKDWPHA